MPSYDHELKTWPEYFESVWVGIKKFELRTERDRTFTVGDRLLLREWDNLTEQYSSREIDTSVSYILRGFGLPPDMVILSLGPMRLRTGNAGLDANL